MSTYLELKTSVIGWLDRSDLNALVPDFIRIALQQSNRVLDILDMEKEVFIQLTETAVDFPLPAEIQKLRNVFIDTIPNRKLVYVTPQQLSMQNPDRGDTIYPATYTIINGNIRLDRSGPIGNSDNVAIQSIDGYPMFTSDVDTNWLNDNAYDVLLYGALLAAEGWLQTDNDNSKLSVWRTQYTSAIEQLNSRAREARVSGDPLRIRAV